MAVLITTNSREQVFADARAYYSMFPKEPVVGGGVIQINSAVALEAQFWTLQGLAWHISAKKDPKDKNTLLVVHGSFDNSGALVGLHLALTTKTTVEVTEPYYKTSKSC